MTTIISFNRTGYDSFIDFIKAYAILCVLIGHTLPVNRFGYGLWAGMQVPLFILVQVFHHYKKDNARLSLKRLSQRVIFPFLSFLLLELLFFFIIEKRGAVHAITIGDAVKWIGGPGSYYPIIYLQIALLLPCFALLFRRLSKTKAACFFIVLSEGLEIICSITQPPAWLYRLLATRYVFLIYLGWLWVKDGVKLDRRMIVLSLLSMLAVVYFEYISTLFSINNEPWFFSTAWTFHRWPCYYYVANGFIFLLYGIWQRLRESKLIERCIRVLAKSTYEVFLMQMVCLNIFHNAHILQSKIMGVVLIWLFSIIGGIEMNSLFNKIKR